MAVRREETITRLMNENETLRRWYSAELPDAAVAATPAPVAPPPVIVYSACPKVSWCLMPGSDPATNGDLSADIRRLEHALAACAQIETVKACQINSMKKKQSACEKRTPRRPAA